MKTVSLQRDNLARHLPQQQVTTSNTPKKKQVSSRSPESKALAREKLLWLGTVIVCIAIALGLVARYANMAGISYEIEKQKQDVQTLKEQQLQLEMQVLQMESAERIKDFATNKLGMKHVDDTNFVILQGSKN